MRRQVASVAGVWLLACAASTAREAPVRAKGEDIAKAVRSAPKVPVDLGLDLTLRLVDYVDFTDPNDPHDMVDRGTSKVVTGPAGRYRVTAAHRHAQFAVRWKADEQDAPHVLVFEYPDDAKREICFFTHESPLSGRKNIDWSLETGVYCGDPLPVSDTMQYHTFFFWPADDWPVAMVMNWARGGPPAAASRLWVFAVDGGLPKLDVEEPDPEDPRLTGTIYNWALVPTAGIFGLKDRHTAMEHIVDYHLYRGDNVLSWPVVSNNSWAFRCQIPAWDGGSGTRYFNRELDDILPICERKGLKFLPVFNPGHGFKIGGRTFKPGDKAYAAGFRKGMEQFLERYGTSKALLGIAFDTQDHSPNLGVAGLDNARDCFGSLAAFTAFMKKKAPHLKVYHLLGGRSIHAQYFPNGGDIIGRWEKGSTPWSRFLADEVLKLWKSWRRDPAELNSVGGLTTVYSYQHDDHAIFDEYSWNPRAMFYYDMEASRAKSALIDTRAAMIWNTFFEGYIGLHPGNWWYLKVWVAPDFNPPPPHFLAGWARAMSHRDRSMIICGAWNQKAGGHEATLRRFSRAFRALPPTELQDVATTGGSPVLVRSGTHKGKTYASVLNPTPFAAEVGVSLGRERKRLRLRPFELEALSGAGRVKVAASGRANAAYVKWVADRVRKYEKLLDEVKALDSQAAPRAFAQHLARVKKLAADGKHLDADVELGHGLTTELELRKRVLAPPQQTVPRVNAAPPMNGDLDAWPARAADIQSTDANIGTHLFFTSQWEGPRDLSARVRLAHDGSKLYIGVAVKDNVLSAKDGMSLYCSQAGYRQWLPQNVKYELSFPMSVPRGQQQTKGSGRHGFAYTSRRTADGYVVEGSTDMGSLGLRPGSKLGWVIQVSDDDNTKHLANNRWARKSVLLVPNEPTFAYWSDARTCCELVFE